MIPKVLIAAPTSEEKDYCFDDWAYQARNFTYPAYDVLLVDNSKDETYHKKIWAKGINAAHVERKGHAIEFLHESQKKIRDFFLGGDYDFLFMLETDVFVPDWMLSYLVAFRHPVHNITYLLYEGRDTTPCVQQLIVSGLNLRSKIVTPNLGFRLWNGKVQDLNQWEAGYDTKLMATGIGCTLIHRSVVEQVPFRIDKEHDKKQRTSTFADTFFHADIDKKGIKNIFDTQFLAEHRRKDMWQPLN